MRRLHATYKIKTRPEDGLDEMVVEVVPWQGNCFNIVSLSRTYWDDEFFPQQKTRYYDISYLTESQAATLKRILKEEWEDYCGWYNTDKVEGEVWLRQSKNGNDLSR